MQHLGLGPTDLLILAVYFVFVLGIGLVLKRSMKRSEDFLLSGRRIPSWIAGLAFLSANLGPRRSSAWRPAARSTA